MEAEEGELLEDGECRSDEADVSHTMEFHTSEDQDSHILAYTDSKAFLKGTQSANPHNDYCQHFVDTGQRPQNFIRDVRIDERFEEYPKLKELIKLKDNVSRMCFTKLWLVKKLFIIHQNSSLLKLPHLRCI